MNRLLSRPLAALLALATLAGAERRAHAAEPLSAEVALREAIEKNPSLGAAISDLAAARALTAREEARYDATLSVALGATHTKTPSLTPGSAAVQVGTNDVFDATATLAKTLAFGTQLSATVESTRSQSKSPFVLGSSAGGAQPLVLTVGPGYLFSAKLGVTQPLLRGAGRDVVLAPYRQAAAREAATRRDRDREASTIARDVLVAYWELWYAGRAAEVDRLARDTARAQRDDATKRMQTGSLARADVLTFETQLATKEETLMQTELDRTTRAGELARLLGREGGATGLEIPAAAPPLPADLPGDPVARALRSSPDVASKEAAVTAAEVEERTAADTYRTKLDLDAYVQAQGLGNDDVPGAFSQLGGLGVLSAHVGLSLELPLHGTRRESEASRAHAATVTAQQNLAATRAEVVTTAASSVAKRDVARRRIALAEASATYAAEQLAAQQALFTSGTGTALQVVQAQDNVQAANKRLARARADLVQAHLALAHLVGALLADVATVAPTRPAALAPSVIAGRF